MKKIPVFIMFISLFACKRDDDNPANTFPNPADTLSAGWSYQSVGRFFAESDIFFINDTIGYLSGVNWICRSKDGGMTWDSVFNKPNSEIVSIGMGDLNRALFVLVPGSVNTQILRTDNGGAGFTTVTIADPFLSNVFFVSPTVVYAIGQKCWKSTDAGNTWTALFDFGTAANTRYKGLFFINEQTGWTTGNTGIYKTTNGGVSWQLVTPVGSYSGELFFTDVNHGFVTDTTKISRSTDGGSSWNTQNNFSVGYHDVHFISPTTGYVSDKNILFKTVNGGTTWTKEVVLLPGNFIYEIHFTDADHGWAVLNKNGTILRYKK